MAKAKETTDAILDRAIGVISAAKALDIENAAIEYRDAVTLEKSVREEESEDDPWLEVARKRVAASVVRLGRLGVSMSSL